jgi:hypothetical protein
MLLRHHLVHERFFLFIVFCAAFFVRALLFYCFVGHGQNCSVYFDSAQYQEVAQGITSGKGICKADGSPNFYRVPGYPIFLSFFMQGCKDVNTSLWVQIFLSSFIPLLLFCLALILFPGHVPFAKGVAVCGIFHLGFVLYSGMIATESLFVLFFLLFLIAFLPNLKFFRWLDVEPQDHGYHDEDVSRMFFAGLMLGVASLIRPVGHFILFIALLMILAAVGSAWHKIKSGGLLLGGWVTIVAWWLLRNYILTGALFFHTLPGLHFLQYGATKVVMEVKDCSYVEARGALMAKWSKTIEHESQAKGRPLNEYERCVVAEGIALRYFFKRPVMVIKHCFLEVMKTCLGLYSAQMVFSDGEQWSPYTTEANWKARIEKYLCPHVKTWYLVPLVRVEIAYSLLLFIGFLGFILWGIFYYRHWQLALLKTMPFILLLIGVTCAYGCARLRLPVEPFLLIFGLYFWSHLPFIMRDSQ